MFNGIVGSKLSKTRHIRVRGEKIEDIKENLNDLWHEEL